MNQILFCSQKVKHTEQIRWSKSVSEWLPLVVSSDNNELEWSN